MVAFGAILALSSINLHPAFALDDEGKQALAIKVFSANGISPIEADLVSGHLRELLINGKYYFVKTSEDQARVIREVKVKEQKEFECGEVKCAVNFGKKMGVSKIVAIKIQKVESDLIATIELVDIATETSHFSQTVRGKSVPDLNAGMFDVVNRINDRANLVAEVQKVRSTAENQTEIIINFTNDDPIKPNMLLNVYRKKGGSNRLIGKLKIIDIQSDQTITSLVQLEDGEEVRPEDSVQMARDVIDNMSNHGSLKLAVSPGYVRVKIDAGIFEDELSEESAQTILLATGKHTITCTKKGYSDQTQNFVIKAGQLESLDIRMAKLVTTETSTKLSTVSSSGKLKIQTNPPGASVFLDGIEIDGSTTPMITALIPFGDHEIILKKDLYYDYVLQCTVSQTGITTLSKINLKPRFGELQIDSDPSGASLYINGEQVGNTPFSKKLKPGTYLVKIFKDKYYDEIKSIEIQEGALISANWQLRPNFGTIDIASTPSDATVYLDEVQAGNTPFTKKLKPGTYQLKLIKDKYHDLVKQIEIKDGSQITETWQLKPTFGTLQINSIPAGAIIELDGKAVGKTPFKGEKLRSTKYKVSIQLPHYKSYSHTYTVSDGLTESDTVRLEPLFGRLNVTATPNGSDVYLDDQKIGVTPLKNYIVDQGSYSVVIKGDEQLYFPYKQDVEIGIGKDAVVAGTLAHKTADLTIDSNPQDAEVYLDGVKMPDNTPCTLRGILTGNHQIKLKRDKLIFQDKVFVGSEKINNLNVKLKSLNLSTPVKWMTVGSPGFSNDEINEKISIAVDSKGTPYVAYSDKSHENRIAVKKFNGSNWVAVEREVISFFGARNPSIAIDNKDDIYVVFVEYNNQLPPDSNSRLTILKYDGKKWIDVSSETKFSDISEVGLNSIVIDNNNIPYISYSRINQKFEFIVKKYSEANWIEIGSLESDAYANLNASLAIAPDGTLYIAGFSNKKDEYAYDKYGNFQYDSNGKFKIANKNEGLWVCKFAEGKWSLVGKKGISKSRRSVLAINPTGTPYLVSSRDQPQSVEIYKYEDSDWISIGDLADVVYNSADIAFDVDGTPYLAYVRGPDDEMFLIGNFVRKPKPENKVMVKKYDGSNWISVGENGISKGEAKFISIAIDRKGIPFIAFCDRANGGRATVMKCLPIKNNNTNQ